MTALLLVLLAATPRAELEQLALTTAGDADAGRVVYASAAMQCAVCHKMDDDALDSAQREGRGVGPDLTAIGNKFDRPHLVDSLLHPSREIGYGYRPELVRLDDGRVLTGLVKTESDAELTLLNAKGERQTIAVADIDERKPSDVSLMPAGLFDTIAADDFVNLVAYLESRRPGGSSEWGAGITGPITLPEGWTLSVVATGLDGLTALETLPDGRVLVCEQTGRVRMIAGDELLPEPVVTLPVDSLWERGVIGVTVDPDFMANGYLYVAWVAKEPYSHHRISRFQIDPSNPNVADPASERVLFEGDDQSQYDGQVLAGHQGGGLHFGPDGCLYLGIGEHTTKQPAQRLDNFLGKIIRINADGSIPSDNPFLAPVSGPQAEGKYAAIWARGCRNPFTFAFRESDGLMLINDVGGSHEEVNVGRAGANYGWPNVDHGPQPGDSPFDGPAHWYPQSSVNGGDFIPEGRPHAGAYVYADYIRGFIRRIDPSDAGDASTATQLVGGLRRPVDLRFTYDGTLYVLLRNSWVIDDKFVRDAGSVVKIVPSRR